MGSEVRADERHYVHERGARDAAAGRPRLVLVLGCKLVSAIEHAVGLAAASPLGAASVSRLFAFYAPPDHMAEGVEALSR